jgi:hypothetical protein
VLGRVVEPVLLLLMHQVLCEPALKMLADFKNTQLTCMHEQNTGTYGQKCMVLFELYVHVFKLKNTVRHRSHTVLNVVYM